jgi:hypothetical protein
MSNQSKKKGKETIFQRQLQVFKRFYIVDDLTLRMLINRTLSLDGKYPAL